MHEWGGALREDTKNGCVADYKMFFGSKVWRMNFVVRKANDAFTWKSERFWQWDDYLVFVSVADLITQDSTYSRDLSR